MVRAASLAPFSFYSMRKFSLGRYGFLFLPAYSLDLNPIEMTFSKLKAQLRRIGARTIQDLKAAIAFILDFFSAQECSNYLVAAGRGLN